VSETSYKNPYLQHQEHSNFGLANTTYFSIFPEFSWVFAHFFGWKSYANCLQLMSSRVWGVENYVGDWSTWKWTQKALVSLNLSPKNRKNRKRRRRQAQRQRNSSSGRPYHHPHRDDHRQLKYHVYGGVANEVLSSPSGLLFDVAATDMAFIIFL